MAGSFGGENGLPGCAAAHDGERTTSASTSIPAVAAASTLRSYGASAYWPRLGSARSQEISIRSLPTPDARICADSEARSKSGLVERAVGHHPEEVARDRGARGSRQASATREHGEQEHGASR